MLDCDSDLVDQYRGNSFVSGVPVFSASEAAELRIQIEALEASHTDGAGGHKLAQFFRVNGDVVIPFPAEVSRTPAIPDKVETVLGPNLLFLVG